MGPAFQLTGHTPPQVTGLFRMGNIGNVKCRVFAGRIHVIKNQAEAGFASDLIKRIRKIDLFADQITELVNAVGRECCKRFCVDICWVRGSGHCAICSFSDGGSVIGCLAVYMAPVSLLTRLKYSRSGRCFKIFIFRVNDFGKDTKNMSPFISSIICLAVVLSFIYIILAFYPILEATIRYGFSDIIDPKININEAGIDGRGFAVGSFREIMSFFKLPDSIFELLFGGSMIRSAHSDSGIIKLIFSTGLVGLFLHLFFYIKLILIFLSYINKNEFKSLILPLLLIMFIFDFKDMNIFSKNVTELLILLLIVFILNNENFKKIKKIKL